MHPTAISELRGAAAYDAFMGRWSHQVAFEFLRWLQVTPRSRWLDVGCGTGALARAIVDSQSPDEVWGIDPLEEYLEQARRALSGTCAQFFAADVQALPETLAGFDATVSGLALNLCPDPRCAFAEMIRVTRPGGVVAVYVWDFADGMQLFRYLWDAAAGLDPGSRELDQGNAFPICRRDRLRDLFVDAGLKAIEVRALEIATPFPDFDNYWQPLLTGHGRAGGYVMSLAEDVRTALRERLWATLPIDPDGSIHLIARAWTAKGTKPLNGVGVN